VPFDNTEWIIFEEEVRGRSTYDASSFLMNMHISCKPLHTYLNTHLSGSTIPQMKTRRKGLIKKFMALNI
jgi:hypothetical protein